jgi:hypothetical protein
MIFLWIPETKQRTFEELDYIFVILTYTHMRYHMQKALPYFISRWILRREDDGLDSLYTFDTAAVTDESRIAQLYENDRRRTELAKGSNGSEGNTEKPSEQAIEGA